MAVLGGAAVSHERGTPVHEPHQVQVQNLPNSELKNSIKGCRVPFSGNCSYGSRADSSNAISLVDGVVIVVLLYRFVCLTTTHVLHMAAWRRSRFKSLELRVWGSGFRVSCFGCRGSGFEFTASYFVSRSSGLTFDLRQVDELDPPRRIHFLVARRALFPG